MTVRKATERIIAGETEGKISPQSDGKPLSGHADRWFCKVNTIADFPGMFEKGVRAALVLEWIEQEGLTSIEQRAEDEDNCMGASRKLAAISIPLLIHLNLFEAGYPADIQESLKMFNRFPVGFPYTVPLFLLNFQLNAAESRCLSSIPES